MALLTQLENKYLLELIPGLEYDTDKNEYVHGGKKYELKGIGSSTNQKSVYFFINTDDPADIVKITTRNGLPIQDDFNKNKIDAGSRQQLYNKAYYNKITKVKRETERKAKEPERLAKLQEAEQKRKEKREAERKAKEELKKARYEALPVLVCPVCGKEFKQIQKLQKFCSNTCHKKYHSKEQAKRQKASLRSIKVCPVCGKEFVGTRKDIYCCRECRVKQETIRSRIAYQEKKLKCGAAVSEQLKNN